MRHAYVPAVVLMEVVRCSCYMSWCLQRAVFTFRCVFAAKTRNFPDALAWGARALPLFVKTPTSLALHYSDLLRACKLYETLSRLSRAPDVTEHRNMLLEEAKVILRPLFLRIKLCLMKCVCALIVCLYHYMTWGCIGCRRVSAGEAVLETN